ncbi:MAG: hypothetical protein RIC35_21930 [Marinoscillum sp.]
MRPEIKKLLLNFDEDGRWETPSNFDYDKLRTQVTKLVNELEKTFDLSFVLDDQVQDASFFADIRIPHELVNNPRTDLEYSLRISNFGNLSTINFQDEYSEATTNKFIEAFKRTGFSYVNADELDNDYDGTFKQFRNSQGEYSSTWYIRYFDYI